MKTKNRFWIYPIVIMGVFLLLTNSCKKDDNDNNNQKPTLQVPVLTTASVSDIIRTSATCGGNITSDGGASVAVSGVCWSTSQNPTIKDNKTTDGTGAGSFTSNITGLIANTTYYVRAYATNSVGTAYGNEISFTTAGTTVTDIDNNVYQIVIIGNQVWMAENLRTTKYRNGDLIRTTTPATLDNIFTEYSPKYQWAYAGEETYIGDYGKVYTVATCGRLYTWYAVTDSRGVCPTGWHVPSNAEWTTLTNYLGGASIAGGKLKEAGTKHWVGPNTGATNSSGFTALPGGSRYFTGSFSWIGYRGFWWSSSGDGQYGPIFRYMLHNGNAVSSSSTSVPDGYSVRCVRD